MSDPSAITVRRVDIDVAGVGAPPRIRLSTRKDA
jgi:hypothetical protein